ncbi:MAG: 6-bladed beta-propeller [Prevotellaceae bacterium]|jgi:hypothetical protein|nr:6-bladed beta-propeller [Prevotellaceae bacterium]
MKKLNKYKIIAVFVLMFVYSCKEKIMQPDVIKIDVSQAKQGILSEIVDSISYIQLETSDECLLSAIGLIQYHDHHYYIYDIRAKTIYIFSETGKYVNKLCKYGQGPGEYLGLNNFTVDSDNRIHILDLGLKQILIYDKSGEFISKINIDMDDYPRDLLCLGNKYMLYMPDKNTGARQGAYIFDPEKNTYTQILHIDEWDNKLAPVLNSHLIEKTNFEYSLVNTYSAIIYNMKGSEIVNKFRFDIGPRQHIGYTFIVCGETDNIINMHWGYWSTGSGESDHVIVCFYDKNTQALKIFRGIKNDIDGKDSGRVWSLNNQLVFDIPGDLDETGFELNPALQIWHLKKINEMP